MRSATRYFKSIRLSQSFTVLIICLCFLTPQMSAQAPISDPNIGFMGIYHNDSVYLRWAPTTFKSYVNAFDAGFKLERALYAINGHIINQDSFEESIITIDENLNRISELAWESIDVSVEIKEAALELFYNFQYEAPALEDINIFNATEEEEKKKTLISLASIIADRDWDAAEALGWGHKDGTVAEGMQYVYILTLLKTDEKFYSLVSTEEPYGLLEVPKPTAFPGDSIMRITFDKSGLDQYYGYYVERSDDLGQTFNLIQESPIAYQDDRNPNLFSFIDSLPDNENLYIYRISGANAFGLQSSWSDTVSVRGIFGPLKASPEIYKIEEAGGGGIGVSIRFDFPEELEEKIQGFEVIRSLDRNGPFLNLTPDLLDPFIREYNDPDPLYSNYYFIRAIDINGYPLLSIPHYYAPRDSIPPAVPQGLSGSIDNSSKSSLTWNRNTDYDIKGYRLFAANSPTGEFLEISPGTIQDTLYEYQLGVNTFNERWYVKIRAVDVNENESDLSTAVLITRPDLHAPSAPVLKDLNAFAFGIGMNWILSPSPDVTLHVLERKLATSNAWEEIFDITNDAPDPVLTKGWTEGLTDGNQVTFHYVDSTVEKRTVYQYRILAYDAAGNVSSSSILEATGYDKGLRGEIFDLMAVDKPYTIFTNSSYIADKDESAIAIGWDYTDTLGVHHFIIYRSADTWPYKAHQSFLVYEGRPNPATTTDSDFLATANSGLNTRYQFIDKDVEPGKVYKYKIVAKHLDGGFSRMSDVVTVTTSTP